MRYTDIDTEVLIGLIKNRPVLWDKTSENYNNRDQTKVAWEEICKRFNKNFQNLEEKDANEYMREIMKRWCNVRDAFIKFCKKEKAAKYGTPETAKGRKIKKYIYHNQMSFLRKLYDTKYAEESYENDSSCIDTETLTTTVHPKTRSQDAEILISTVYSETGFQDMETLYNAGLEDNLTSAETAASANHHLGSNFNKLKRFVESTELQNSKILDGEKSSRSYSNKRKRLVESDLKSSKIHNSEQYERHLSFFKGIIPSLEEFNQQEILKFQMGVLQLIGSINDQRLIASHAQLPAQFFSFPSQPGPSTYLPSIAASYPPGQAIFPTFWSAACSRCSSDSCPKSSSDSCPKSNNDSCQKVVMNPTPESPESASQLTDSCNSIATTNV